LFDGLAVLLGGPATAGRATAARDRSAGGGIAGRDVRTLPPVRATWPQGRSARLNRDLPV